MGSTKASARGLKESAGTAPPPLALRTGLVAGLLPVTTEFVTDIGRTEGLEIRFIVVELIIRIRYQIYGRVSIKILNGT